MISYLFVYLSYNRTQGTLKNATLRQRKKEKLSLVILLLFSENHVIVTYVFCRNTLALQTTDDILRQYTVRQKNCTILFLPYVCQTKLYFNNFWHTYTLINLPQNSIKLSSAASLEECQYNAL